MQDTGTFKVTTPTEREIVMTRDFNAPRAAIFEALTKPELVRRWLLGPPPWWMAECEIDLKAGGAFRYVWRRPEGKDMGMRGVYREVTPPERIVNTEVFDEPWYEGEAVVTTVLEERGDRTTLTATVLYDSREIRDGVLEVGVEKGVEASYNLLAELLEQKGAAQQGATA